MHSNTNVNVRAARNLVNTVYASREQQRSALTILERTIVRKERTLRRMEAWGWVAAVGAAAAAVAVALAIAVVYEHHGAGAPQGVEVPLLILLGAGAPTLAAMLTVDAVGRRITTTELNIVRQYQRRGQLEHLILRLNITVKESEQELADRERMANA
jgi:hypothetical protein